MARDADAFRAMIRWPPACTEWGAVLGLLAAHFAPSISLRDRDELNISAANI